LERRLAAILAADVVGYTRLMGKDEAGTLRHLTELRQQVLEPLITEHHGRVVKLTGDGLLVEFASVVDALTCAVAWQTAVVERETEAVENRRLKFRIGINLGDVIVEGDDIHGDGVNVAARLEGLAEPDGICLSSDVYRQVRGKLEAEFEDLGERELKNVAEPIRVYRVVTAGSMATAQSTWADALPLPDKPSIAVLPFTNMSGDPEQEYFSDGVTEDIITELSRFRSLFVIARNSSFYYKGQSPKVQQVGGELGVRYVVEGSVRKAGNRVRITAQLVEAKSGNHLWAERYDRDLEDIFAVQDEITETIAAMISGRLQAEDRRRASQTRHTDPTAYDLVLRAQALYFQISRAANAEARPLLEQAIDLDPGNARAHLLLAAIHHMDCLQGWSHAPQRSLDRALELGQRAIALDDADSLAHAQLGEILVAHQRFPEARRHLEKALVLNPNDVEARAIYGGCIGGERGLEAVNFAERLDPCSFVWIPWIKGTVLFELKRYDEAIAALSQIDSRIISALGWLAASLAHAGRLEEAKRTLQAFLTKAKMDFAIFPENAAAWASFWRREGQHRNEEAFEQLREGLRKAGLDV
jgi:adenylate cyclase